MTLPNHFRKSLAGLSVANCLLSLPLITISLYLAVSLSEKPHTLSTESQPSTPNMPNTTYTIVVSSGFIMITSLFGILISKKRLFRDHCLSTAYAASSMLCFVFLPVTCYMGYLMWGSEGEWKVYVFGTGMFFALACGELKACSERKVWAACCVARHFPGNGFVVSFSATHLKLIEPVSAHFGTSVTT